MAAEENPHAKAKTADGAEVQADKPAVTHDLYLADGSVVESSGAVPTHIAVGDREIPVLHALERKQQA